MLTPNFENKMSDGPETKDLIVIDGKRVSRTTAVKLRDDLAQQMAKATDEQESKRLALRISAINKALNGG